MDHILNKALGGFLGLAIGDAIGAQVEFRPHGTFPPVTDMVGGGVFGLRPGYITDDTQMAMLMASSLIANKGFNPHEVMEAYLNWSFSEDCFDIGKTIQAAIRRFHESGEPYQGIEDDDFSGNGSIMRLYPSILWTLKLSDQKAWNQVWDMTRITHASSIVRAYTATMNGLIRDMFHTNKSKEQLMSWFNVVEPKPTTSGFVKDTFEAAIWGFATTDNFEAGLFKVVNLGGDADTAGAVYGQIAGTWYGAEGIPKKYRERVQFAAEISELTRKLL